MRTSFGQNTHVPGHGNGLVNTVTGVTPESVRTGRRRSRHTKSASSAPSANARNPAMISDFENRPRPCLGWRRTIRSRRFASSAGSQSTAFLSTEAPDVSMIEVGAGGARLHGALRKVSESVKRT